MRAMTTSVVSNSLPATIIQAEAEQFAAEVIARMKEKSDVGGLFNGLAPLGPDTGHVFVRRLLKQIAQSHPLNMNWLMGLARSDIADAEAAMDELLAEYAARPSEPLPPQIATYAIELAARRANGGRRGGSTRTTNSVQDIAICVLIILLKERFGFKVNRSQIGKKKLPSCSSVAAAALARAGVRAVDEGDIQKIWSKRGPSVQPISWE